MMKGRWKILVAVAIVGVLAMPMMSVKAAVNPQYHGDIVFAECEGRDDFPSWDHTTVWDNNDKEIIEADPHFENWEDEEADWTDGTLGYLYPNKDPEDFINKN
ncbi:MAG: hypothetical protein U9O96_06765 [Candidatus Thermoplasmatota archaeon]|nr:hypothetical protein [Candidatus Thermoplasmatota archaeon]